MSKYIKQERFLNGGWVTVIVASNGKVVATCSSQAMADKILRGLRLADEEAEGRANFRL